MGKWAERQVRLWLDERSAKDSTFAFHRYPDARAARGALAAQPADFIAANSTRVWHIETKETAQSHRLPKAKVRQYGMLRKFWWAGIEPCLPIFRSTDNDWVALGPNELFMFEDCPPSFLISALKSYPTAADLLQDILK